MLFLRPLPQTRCAACVSPRVTHRSHDSAAPGFCGSTSRTETLMGTIPGSTQRNQPITPKPRITPRPCAKPKPSNPTKASKHSIASPPTHATSGGDPSVSPAVPRKPRPSPLSRRSRPCGKPPVVIIRPYAGRALPPFPDTRPISEPRPPGLAWSREPSRDPTPEWIPTGDLPCGAATARVKCGR